jgi:Putative MetA-pathway of phenol degradation
LFRFCNAGFAAVSLFIASAALGDPTTQPDKSQYTIFNPSPTDQLRDMDTDRPNKTNTPHTIDAGHLQIEIGVFDYDYYRDQYDGANARTESLDLGQFNFRMGILDNLELNAVINSFDFLRNTDYASNQSARQNGFGDTLVGGKLNLWGNETGDTVWATALGIQPQFKIPTARENIGNGHPELFVGFPFLMNLPAGFHLGLESTVSDERNSTDTSDVAGWQNSISVDRVILGNFDVYIEYWIHVSTETHQESQQTLDVGFTYPVNDNVVLDTGANIGLNKASDTLEWVAGISLRF